MTNSTGSDITRSLLCLTERRGTCGVRSLGDQRGHVANLWGDDRRSGQNVTHRFGRLQSVPRDAQYNLIIGMEVPGLGERERSGDRDTTCGLGEHAGRLGEKSDAGEKRSVAHGVAASAG